MRKLVKEIALREGKRSQTSIANIREILKCFADIVAEYKTKEGDEHADLMREWFEYIDKKEIKLKSKKARKKV